MHSGLRHATKLQQKMQGCTRPAAVSHGRLLVVNYREERRVSRSRPTPEALSQLPEQPITTKYPLPQGLDQDLPQPGTPRAFNIPDRFHPEEDGAEPRVKQTVLQQHVEFFDYDKDGVIWPWDTARGFREVGYNPLISVVAAGLIHSGMSLASQEGFPDVRLPILIKNIHKCKHGSDTGVYDNEGRYVPQKFEEIFSKYDRDNKGGLTYKELMDMCSEQANVYDWFGRLADFLEWSVTYYGFKDENGVLPREAMRKQYNGELFYEYARKIGKNFKEKKFGGSQ